MWLLGGVVGGGQLRREVPFQDLRPAVQYDETVGARRLLNQLHQRVDERLSRRARIDHGGGLLQTLMHEKGLRVS